MKSGADKACSDKIKRGAIYGSGNGSDTKIIQKWTLNTSVNITTTNPTKKTMNLFSLNKY